MYNATTKFITLMLIAASALTSCGDKKSAEAQELYNNAETMLNNGEASRAVAMLDSLDSAYADQIDLRRRGMHLRALAIEKLTVEELSHADSLLAQLTAQAQQMNGSLKTVDNAIEPYYIAVGSTLAPTGIEARMAPDGVVYVVSSLSGHPAVRHTAITASCGGKTASTAAIAYDGERSTRSGGVETVHFVGAECDSLVRFITSASEPVTITWYGASTFSRPLTANEQQSIATVGTYALTATEIKLATLRHQRLERQLETARSHIARTFPDSLSQQSGR